MGELTGDRKLRRGSAAVRSGDRQQLPAAFAGILEALQVDERMVDEPGVQQSSHRGCSHQGRGEFVTQVVHPTVAFSLGLAAIPREARPY